MRHNVHGRTLGRKTNHRLAMFANMAMALFTHGEITTTIPKAKAVKPYVERLITAAKKGTLADRRRAVAGLGWDKPMVKNDRDESVTRNKFGEMTAAPTVSKHLFDVIGPAMNNRVGGYTRIIKLAKHRLGDGTDLCVLQLVQDAPKTKPATLSPRREKANKRTAFAAKAKATAAAVKA